MTAKILDRAPVLAEFDNSPDSALFNQIIIALVMDCSTAKLERDRWIGGGIPFVKIGRMVKYRKSDVVAWLNRHESQSSTSETVAA